MNTMTTTATTRQTFALFCATGKDWRASNLTAEVASAMIAATIAHRGNKQAALEVATAIAGGLPVPTVPQAPAKPSFKSIYNEAHKAGLEAMKACTPEPMLIPGYAPIMGGVCGFAGVKFPDARKPFAKWMVKQGHASKGYGAGVSTFAGFEIGGQSLTLKEAYCYAMAKVFNNYGIDARVESRID
jgi:hypothetical protein